MTQATTLVIVFDGVEELEALAPVDCLRRAGVEVTMAANGTTKRITGRNQIILEADVLLDEALSEEYDLVVIPGGPGHTGLTRDSRVLNLLKQQNDRTGWIGSICAGPIVLDFAGILHGRAFTSFPATAKTLPRRDGSRNVVLDGNLITAQGAGCSIEFALALVEALCGEEMRLEIAASICT